MDLLALAPVIAWLGLSGVVMYSISGKDTDQQKIEKVFRHKGYGVKNYFPSLIRTIKKDAYTEYVYNVPYGLTDDDDKLKPLEKTLDKPVHVYFDGKLHIQVFKEDLPMKINHEWKETESWHVPVGMDQSGMVYHSFDKIPHMTIAGMTRQGKTVLLKLIMGHLIWQHGEDVEFYIIDLKGGLEFNKYRNLKQVNKRVASDVYEANKMLKSIHKDIRADMSGFKEKGYTNILDTQISRRRFVIVDEAAELTPQAHHTKEEKAIHNECHQILGHIARIGGAMGYRLIHCTQYPLKENLPSQIKQNADAKISFRLPTEIASRVAIDENGAERLSCPGRAIYRTHDKKLLQVPYVSDKDVWEKVKQYEVKPDVTEPEEESSVGTDCIEVGGVRICDQKTSASDLQFRK